MNVLEYSLLSALIVSLVSFIGIVSLGVQEQKLRKILIYTVSFSAGALFGDAFLHLIPQVSHDGLAPVSSIFIIAGILIFFGLEKIIHWRHCHMPITKTHVHPFAYMNLIGDGLHNFIDGLIIVASYMISIPVGIATSIAVFFHEIPQEIGEFGILIHGGFSKNRAIMLNFLTALIALLGVIIGFVLKGFIPDIAFYVVPLAIGGFIYIAGSDLIPELHKETKISVSLMQILAFIIGVAIMAVLLLLD